MNKKTIIVVEDDQDILEILHLILHEDYEIHLFTIPPQDFVSIVAKKKPDLIIFDWLIPNTVIEDYFEPIRKDSPNTKIIVTSAHNNVEKYFKDKDVDAILPKPFGVNDLKVKIKRLLTIKKTTSSNN